MMGSISSYCNRTGGNLRSDPSKSRRGPLRAIIGVLREGEGLFHRPFVELECGHRCHSDGAERARCSKCASLYGGPGQPFHWLLEVRASGCWEWTGNINNTGYGVVSLGGRRSILAHRAAWEHENGPITPGAYICHHCDNPKCCNPEHLFEGTQADNMRDMVAKGRHRGPVSRVST